MRNIVGLFIVILMFSYGQAGAQPTRQSDTAWQRAQIRNAEKVYQRQFSGANMPVYQGYQYVPYILPATGNVYYPSKEWQRGAVFFKGSLYRDLPLLYDILKDQLVLESSNGQYRILLAKKNVDWFSLDSLRFIHIHKNAATQDLPPDGYYEKITGAPAVLLIKREKKVMVPRSQGEKRYFAEQNRFYIKEGDTYYRVRSRRSVLKALSDEKTNIRKYLKDQDIRFGRYREKAIRQVVTFYNKLKNT